MFITAAEVRSLTSFGGVRELTDSEIDGYLARADLWIRRSTNRDYSLTDDLFVQEDMRLASWLLVEYLWLWDNPELKEEAMSHDEVIRLGSFSVNKKDRSEDNLTGVDELDQILIKYRYKPVVGGFFKVLGKKD